MIKSMLVIIAVVVCVTVAHPQEFYPASFSYQNSFVRHDPPQPYTVSEKQARDRFTNAHFTTQSAQQRFMDSENEGMDRFTNAQATKQSAQQRFTDREYQIMDRFRNAQVTKQSAPQQFMDRENQSMDRFANSQYNKQSSFRQRGNEGENAAVTAQRRNDYNDRDRFENFNNQFQ